MTEPCNIAEVQAVFVQAAVGLEELLWYVG